MGDVVAHQCRGSGFLSISVNKRKLRQETSVQLDKPAGLGYVEITKNFKEKMPCTLCRITRRECGMPLKNICREALKSYLVGKL